MISGKFATSGTPGEIVFSIQAEETAGGNSRYYQLVLSLDDMERAVGMMKRIKEGI